MSFIQDREKLREQRREKFAIRDGKLLCVSQTAGTFEVDEVGTQYLRDLWALRALGLSPVSIFEGPYKYRIVPFWQTAAGWWGP